MVSFDLSTTNIILTVAVVGLFIFFITLLMKLNPSTEKKGNIETQLAIDRQKPLQTPIAYFTTKTSAYKDRHSKN